MSAGSGGHMIPDLTPSEVARFYSKICVGGCGMRWSGPINNHGYGRFEIYRGGKRVRILAHRLAYKLATGEDPGDAVVRHGCDTPPCCTPDCFLLGTQAENIRDAVERERHNSRGLSAWRAGRDARASDRLVTWRKRCARCKVVKTLDDFSVNRTCVDGHAYWCKSCVTRAASAAVAITRGQSEQYPAKEGSK